jgi:SAM-dependent methyltransferase
MYESVGDFIMRATPAEKQKMAAALSTMSLTPLNLAQHFDPELTDKDTIHSYVPEYEKLLYRFNDVSFNMMEVGIQRGGSILAWLKAFPKATVIGVDCQKTVNINGCDRYKELITNAYDDEFMTLIQPKSLDFIIDDGSHAYNDIRFACENYPKLLKSGGILVIEDIPDVKWIPKLRAIVSAQGCFTEVIDLREKKGRWDDVLLVIRKSWAGPTGTA